jgi:preprotein translocase subunit SecY
MNIIRNLNDRTRVAVYATSYIAIFTFAVAALVLALEVLSNLIGDTAAFAVLFGGFGAYIAISTAVMTARFRVERERRERTNRENQ